MVWDEVVGMAVSNGFFAVLFVALLLHTLKDGKNRENKYQETIRRMSSALAAVNEIKTDTEFIRRKLSEVKVKNPPPHSQATIK
jgi:hypothetical protein